MTGQMKNIKITYVETVSDTNANNPGSQSPKRKRLSRLLSPQLASPNRHFIETGDSDPHYDDEESCASDGPSTRQQSQQKSVQLPKNARTFGTTLNRKV